MEPARVFHWRGCLGMRMISCVQLRWGDCWCAPSAIPLGAFKPRGIKEWLIGVQTDGMFLSLVAGHLVKGAWAGH